MSDGDQTPVDDELMALLGEDRDMVRAASEVRAVLRESEIDPAFLRQLRSRVVAEHERLAAQRAERGARGWPRRRLPDLRWPVPAAAAGFAAAVLAFVVALTVVVPRVGQPAPVGVAATSAVAGLSSVDPASPVVVRFSRPMDHGAVAAALRVVPATAVRTSWSGNDLVVTPLHGLVANAPYVLTFDRTKARTTAGAAPATDLHVVFGTAPVPFPGGAAPPAVGLPLHFVAAAGDGSEAVIATNGTLVATSATAYGFAGLLRLHADGTVERLGPATDAICVSRSGQSLAYLTRGGGGSSIVMAAGDGSHGQAVRAAVDDGSPLGWINDAEVSFVGGGRLQAVDRSGHTRALSDQHLEASNDTIAIAPGGRYVYVRPATAPATPGQGSLVDLVTHATHPLPGIVGQPAYSADGGTVAWFDESGHGPRLASAPSAGGPVLTVPLPAAAADELSDLGLSPDGSRLVYSVKHPAGDAELRLAAADDGATLAAARQGGGESPNWAPAGNRVAVLTHAGSQAQIEVADVPAETVDAADRAEAVANTFADAQIDGDRDAMRALASAQVALEGLPGASRASVVQVVSGASGAWVARIRLVIDPMPAHPAARSLDETLNLRLDPQLQRPVVGGVGASRPADVPAGPHVVRIGRGAQPGTIALAFDSDLDTSSLRGAFDLRTASGGRPALTTTYDAAGRTVTLAPPAGLAGPLSLTVGTSLRDVAGQHLRAPVTATVTA